MMEPKRRFTILPFPQFFNGGELTLNVVVLPRNQNPLAAAVELDAVIPDAPAFADAALAFNARIITGLGVFPHSQAANVTRALPITPPTNARALFEALGNNFSINNFNQSNADLQANADKADPARPLPLSLKKYLPRSYREAFHFTTPRTPNAVTDDSYACAVRDAGKTPGFQRSSDDISWGKVFAFALRQPLLARRLGMIYTTSVTIDPTDYPEGGWLYVDLADGSDYRLQEQADPTFIKKYAARIPALAPGGSRPVFAPLLFPVLLKNAPADPDPAPDGNFDQVMIEAAEYDDGFAKIMHCTQPRSRNLLAEDADGASPVKDAGLRLGWDDEQLLIWHLRQIAEDPTVTHPDKRLDAPLGVFGYAIDVRETQTPENPWESLNHVTSNADLVLPVNPAASDETIALGGFQGELPYQVYPVLLDGNPNNNFWLPMYFANWLGHSMVLPDPDAAAVYRTTDDDVQADPEDPVNQTGTGVSGPARNRLNTIYSPGALDTRLRYGRSYDFRVRLRDLSGGGAGVERAPVNQSAASVGRCRFKRYVPPHQPRVADLAVNTDAAADPDGLSIRRPLLGYPTVVYTGAYADPVASLQAASQAMQGVEAFGIPDPDVDRLEITVEVETLKLDNRLSVSGKDNYVHLYTTERFFPAVNDEADFDQALSIPVTYQDVKVLYTGPELNVEADFNLPDSIHNLAEIVLPTARTVRLTLRAVCADKAVNGDYYGVLDAAHPDRDSRFGQTVQVMLYRPSTDETGLFVDSAPATRLQGIFLQPEEPAVLDGRVTSLLLGKERRKAPDLVQRLAQQLDLENIGLTLTPPKGERVQFACSSRIRHTLSPDHSSLTFSSKGDLASHWLCCVQLTLDRDWTWNALEDRSLVVERTLHFSHDAAAETETAEVGEIELRRSASFEALHASRRNYTRLIFIDAVEPKNTRRLAPPQQENPRFPDTIEVSYRVTAHFKPDHAAQQDAETELGVVLPITTPPAQTPKIASAGLALSPYVRNEEYSETGTRQRFLWIEFDEPVRDPQDTYFARVLAYAPDQLISNNHPELRVAPEEPALPIPPEEIRVVAPGATNDLAGLTAMQPMQKATDSDRHYLLPLPPGLHADADEMFGFFTYEFRVGHFRHRDAGATMVWSTAQGRFGRPLRATGIQHPAPTLTCAVNRDEEKLYVTAPYAVAVMDGKNVTADPPRTHLWCLLYAQVRQADGKDFRNILLDDKRLDWRVQIETDKDVNPLQKYDENQLQLLKDITISNFNDTLSYANLANVYKLVEFGTLNKDAAKYGTVVWGNQEVGQLLELFGLPEDASLSVLVVEFLSQITNRFEHISVGHRGGDGGLGPAAGLLDLPTADVAAERQAQWAAQANRQRGPSPLREELGHHRILRTSPLTKVPFVCCPTC